MKKDLFYLNSLIFSHNLIFLLALIGAILIFNNTFKLFFSIFYVIIVICEGVFRSDCPLTLIEDKLRERLGLEIDEDIFVNRTLKQYFNFTISKNIVILFLVFYFLFSCYSLYKYI